MAGMNVLGSAGISDYKNRTVTIEVAGVCQQSVLKTSNYQVRVPYSQMSEAMQSINRQGGRVASVQIMGNPPVRFDGAENEASSDDNTDSAEDS
ncbi:MAG: phycobilisome linker polypeptide [Cyanobacteria bacterium J06623_4]